MRADALLRLLAGGAMRSAEELARVCAESGTALDVQIAELERCGVEIEPCGPGYRLRAPLDLIDRASVARRLRLPCGLARLEVMSEVDSTNRYLLELPPAPNELAVCLAEHQTAGRGRRGRPWFAPFGAGLCLSVGWVFAARPADLPALTLAVGVVVRRVLSDVARVEPALKWPNDLLWRGRKLGGILLELARAPGGGCHVVVGIGVNVSVPDRLFAQVPGLRESAVDLRTAAGTPPRRELLAARLIESLADLLATYGERGFAAYRGEWSSADHLYRRMVRVEAEEEAIEGIAGGVGADGALLLELEGGARRRVLAGEVSVRTLP
jgi:BirA family biotin operon repressor/biotin-[acetyl-CoA-carboxylase] ligase